MRVISSLLILLLVASPAIAQQPAGSIRASAEKAAQASPAQGETDRGRGSLFWSGLAFGIAGVTTAVLAGTVYRVDDTSTGNAPVGAYQACVAQQKDPIYASNACGALKGKNRALLWSGVAVGALGAGLMIGSTRTSAEIGPGTVRLLHTIRF